MKHLNRKVFAICVCAALWMMASMPVMAARVFPPDVRFPGLDVPDYQLQATVNGSEVTFTWNEITAPSGRTLLGYHVYRSQSPDFPLTDANRVTEFAVKRTSLIDRAAAGTYYYVVQAICTDLSTAAASKAITVEIGLTSAVPSTTPMATTTPGSAVDASSINTASIATATARNVPLSTELQDFVIDLRLEGIPGSLERSEWSGFGDILVTSFTWSSKTSLPASYGGGMGTAKPSFSDLVITKPIDRASPTLALVSAMGNHIREAVLTVYRKVNGNNVPSYTIHLRDILISSDSIIANPDGLIEQVSLNYSKIEWSYCDVKTDGTSDGKRTATYDIQTTKGN